MFSGFVSRHAAQEQRRRFPLAWNSWMDAQLLLLYLACAGRKPEQTAINIIALRQGCPTSLTGVSNASADPYCCVAGCKSEASRNMPVCL